ncbi:hypothetical protein H0H92_015650 [Tricholoma furcatifolium]|nr:hypothetical protein H0H92_015650 [Tricholoma furcatifolium]
MTGVLDVEDPDGRLNRLQSTLEKLNSTPSKFSGTPDFSFLNKADSKPRYVPPPTDPHTVLSRVHAFLPAIEASNALLASQGPEKIDIEHVDNVDGPYIEMNLGLGLFDVRGSTTGLSTSPSPPFPLSGLQSVSPMSYMSSSSQSSNSTFSSSSDEDSDEDDTEIITSFTPIRPIKPLPRRAAARRPGIVVLGSTSSGLDERTEAKA